MRENELRCTHAILIILCHHCYGCDDDSNGLMDALSLSLLILLLGSVAVITVKRRGKERSVSLHEREQMNGFFSHSCF